VGKEAKIDFMIRKQNPEQTYPANMTVEFLKIVRRDSSGLDKRVEFQDKLIPNDIISNSRELKNQAPTDSRFMIPNLLRV